MNQIGNSVIGEIKVNESAFKNQVMEETCQSMLNFEHQLKTNIPMWCNVGHKDIRTGRGVWLT